MRSFHCSRAGTRCGHASRALRAAFVVAAVVPGTLHAVVAEPALPPLSLMEAIRRAEEDSPAIEARKAAVASAEDAVEPAGALPDPQLVIGVDNLPVDTADAFHPTRDFMTMRKIGVMQDFPRSDKRHSRAERARAIADKEHALLTTQRLSVREGAARAWIARSMAERRLQLLQDLRPRAEAAIAVATAALGAGRGSAIDGIGARSAQASLEDRIDQSMREVEEARADFARWLPAAGDRPLGDATDWSVLGADPEALITKIAHHRELLAYDAAERAANADVDLARADRRPDWSVELDYAQRAAPYSNMVTVEFRVGLPIFGRPRQDGMIASKQAAAAQVEAEREDARRLHTAELRKALSAWRSAGERVKRYERELLPLADDRADVAIAAYRGGRGNLQAVLDALDQAIETRIAWTDLENAFGQAWAELHFAFPEEH